MNDKVPDPSTDIQLPPPEGKISIVVAVCRLDAKGNARLMRRVCLADCGGGLEREAHLIQARAHQMVTFIGADIELHGWGERRPADPTSGEGSPL